MKDLTQGSIHRHVLAMAIPMAAGMALQAMYFFVDLYFVARLGDAAIAGAGAGGNLIFAVYALTQMLGVGTVTMVAHAVGREDRAGANHVFNQSVALAAILGAITLFGGYAVAGPYMRFFGADAATTAAGETFLRWLVPGLALQFAIVVMSAGLRGTGIVKPAMVSQSLTVVLNTMLAPVLVAGWGTGRPMGVAGAGLATSLSIAACVVVLGIYFLRLEHYVAFDLAHWRPKLRTWLAMLNLGLPAGGEFAFMALFAGIMYWAARDFGAAAQAGYGVGSRINQMVFMPALALGFAAAPIAGQNFGARKPARVRETFRVVAIYGFVVMALLTGLVQWKAESFARVFTTQPAVIAVTVEFLHYISWNFVTAGFVFACSSMFQALGNTWPSLGSSAVRVVTFALPALWMARQPWFQLQHVFVLSVVSQLVQLVASYLWLKLEFRRRLPVEHPAPAVARAAHAG